ncbi:MAG TPA: hypothetical protein VN087_02805 [Verrucomicrobiae bacterium]|nr:hypothetical protein [Verrucomicrobiae bacterium]
MRYILKGLLAALLLIFGQAMHAQDVPSHNFPSPAPPMLIQPAGAAVLTRSKVTLTVYASNGADLKVTWSVNGDPSMGTIDPATGVYTAPDDVPDNPPKVTATSIANPDHKASVTIVVNAASCPSDVLPDKACVMLTPLTRMVRPGEHVALSAKAVKVADPSVTWQVNVDQQKDDTGGKIEGTGEAVKYTAPTAVPAGKVEVKAVAARDSNVSATAEMIVVAPYVSAHCVAGDSKLGDCRVTKFNRLDGPAGSFATGPVSDRTDAAIVAAVNASKALVTGSVLEVPFISGVTAANCKNYDWKIVAQTEESPNILIYNPSDIGSGICTGVEFVIALPVRVLWADISGFPQQPDPQRTAPADFTALKDCWGQSVPQTISPCDRNVGLMRSIYASTWVWTHFGQAGSAQGAISLSPVIGAGQRQLSFDVQADPAYKVGLGWLNIPLTFEKSTSEGSNLDALIVGLAYDLRALKNPNLTRTSHFVLRKPQFQVRTSVEIAPTTPHDKNWVEAGTIKFPLVFNFHQQPSAFTAYPVIGVEGGSHFDTHLVENEAILRGVAGVDGSFRWPFNLTHNFLGSSPITFEYSYRIRWLAYAEPITSVADNGTEMLATGRRSFLRGSFIEPVTPNLQFQITAMRGSLPPDFRVLGNTLVIGLTFTNPGSSEH